MSTVIIILIFALAMWIMMELLKVGQIKNGYLIVVSSVFLTTLVMSALSVDSIYYN